MYLQAMSNGVDTPFNKRRVRRQNALLLILSCCCAAPLSAGSLDSPAPPDDPSGAMYTVEDLYQRLAGGAAGAKRTTPFAEPSAGPGPTGHTLNQVMDAAPAPDNANGATPADVLSGKTYWGLTGGGWGLQTGSAAPGSDVTGANGLKTFPIPDGLYSGGKTATANDANLTAGNIKSGVTLFGVAGNYTGIGGPVQDTSSGDAVASDIRNGKKAWVDGIEITGNVPDGNNVTGGDGLKTFPIPDGLYSGGKTATANDANLVTGNIRAGITLFGVAGKPEVVDTTSGDAVAADLATGKKAWVDGAEITGTGALSAYPAPVPKTGQTTCYDVVGTSIPCAATGQDGDLQKGVAHAVPRFTDNSDGTVTDNTTGLIWLQNANCAATTRTWSTALSDVASLNGAGTMNGHNCNDTSNAGSHQTDWRLPNRKELLSLIDLQNTDPALPTGHPFSNVQGGWYWSSTTYMIFKFSAWAVFFADAGVSALGKGQFFYVWPVRGGQ